MGVGVYQKNMFLISTCFGKKKINALSGACMECYNLITSTVCTDCDNSDQLPS